MGLVLAAARLEAASCESLASLTLPQTTVTVAEQIAAGAFVTPGPPPSRSRAARGSSPRCRPSAAWRRR